MQEAGIEYSLMGGVQPNPVDTPSVLRHSVAAANRLILLLPVGAGAFSTNARQSHSGRGAGGVTFGILISGRRKVTKALKVAVLALIIPLPEVKVPVSGYNETGTFAENFFCILGGPVRYSLL